jgi:hypothetical protein
MTSLRSLFSPSSLRDVYLLLLGARLASLRTGMTFKGWGVVGTDLAVRDSSIILIL